MEGLVEVRALATRDIDAVLAIQTASPEISQWSREAYVQAVSNAALDAWVAEERGVVCGFLVARVASSEMEVLNLAVPPATRRRGFGRRLLEAAFGHARGRGAERAFLEVRESNASAIAFYQRLGFVPAGRRARYYSHPAEDALLFSRPLA